MLTSECQERDSGEAWRLCKPTLLMRNLKLFVGIYTLTQCCHNALLLSWEWKSDQQMGSHIVLCSRVSTLWLWWKQRRTKGEFSRHLLCCYKEGFAASLLSLWAAFLQIQAKGCLRG